MAFYGSGSGSGSGPGAARDPNDFYLRAYYPSNGFPTYGGPGSAPWRPRPLLASERHQGLFAMGPNNPNMWDNASIMRWVQGQPASASGYAAPLENSLGMRFGGSSFGSRSSLGSGGSNSGGSGAYGW